MYLPKHANGEKVRPVQNQQNKSNFTFKGDRALCDQICINYKKDFINSKNLNNNKKNKIYNPFYITKNLSDADKKMTDTERKVAINRCCITPCMQFRRTYIDHEIIIDQWYRDFVE